MPFDKTILITGCSSGFGRLTAELMARNGSAVFAGMRDIGGRNASAAEELEAWSRREGLDLTVLALDVTDDASVDAAVRRVLEKAGRIDVLVNNAGVLPFGLAEAFTPAQVRDVFEVNVVGSHRMSRAVLTAMRHQGSGLIVQVSSVLGRYTLPCFGVYSASKSALEALAESMSDELAGTGVEVAIVEPGAYPTGLADKIMGPSDPGRAAEYREGDTIERKVSGCFQELTQGPDAPHPQEVARTIAHLIALPAGTRPLRTVIGRACREPERFNAAAAEFRQRALEELGLS